MFELNYEPLFIGDNPVPWTAAVIPWDTETFGFNVSALKPCAETEARCYEAAALARALEDYSARREVRAITASIPAEHSVTSCLLQNAGFHMVDVALSVRYRNVQAAVADKSPGVQLHPAVPSEWETLARIAQTAFHHGRYHLDPRFDASLADRRYSDWVRRCLEPGSSQQLLTAAVNGQICGFSVVEYKNSGGYLHLHAIESAWQGKKLGPEMILASLKYLSDLGGQNVDTKISASNLRAINMHARLNAVFTAAEYLLHWHREKNDKTGV